MKSDYLKYYRVVIKYIKVKYEISQADLDMLLFLYSEGYFGVDKFSEYSAVLNWDRKRFYRLMKEGWIENFRERFNSRKALYALTFKSKRMINSLYKKLEGGNINTHQANNPMFAKGVGYSNKVYRNMIIKMNQYNKKKGIVVDDIPE